MTTAASTQAAPAVPDPPPGTAGPVHRHPPRRGAAGLLRPVRRHLIWCAVLSAAGTAAGLAPYIAIAEIARTVLGRPEGTLEPSYIWVWIAIGSGGAAARLLLLGASSLVGHHADATLLHDIRVQIVNRIGRLPLGWFRRTGSGQVKKAMTDDLEEMHHLIAHALGQIVAGATAIALGLAYLLSVDPVMASFTAAVPALMIVSYRIAMRSMVVHVGRLMAAEARISTASVEYADGITVVKTFGNGRGVVDKFGAAVAEHTEALRRWVAETRYSSAGAQLLSSEVTILAVVLAAGVPAVAAGHIAPADLIPFLVIGVGLPTSLTPMIQGTQGLRKARMAAAHIDGLLAQQPLPEAVRPQEPADSEVHFDQVRFGYDEGVPVLDGIDLRCPPGSITALVGPSGAGKSTLASLLPRFYDVTGGAIRIGGVDVRDMATGVLLSTLTLVFQDVTLLRDTVRENIRIARPGACEEDVRRAAVVAQIDGVIERLPDGYDTVLDGAGGGLSGGERQRLTIARAILADAPVVVLDEATAALDPDGEAAVQDALAQLVAGKTVIIIAHRLHTIAHADQIVVLDRGKVAEAGRHDELLAVGGTYARMWRAQNGARS